MALRLAISLANVAALVAVLALPSTSYAQGVPGVDKNKCLAGKNKCVSKKLAGLLKCREKCQKSTNNCGQKQTDCEAKVMKKFDGGTEPSKGCFAKLESKADPSKPDSVCTTTGDTAAVEAEVDAVAADLLARLEGTPAPTCGDGTVNVIGEHCDGADLGGTTCSALGFQSGALGCAGCVFDASGCGDCAIPAPVDAPAIPMACRNSFNQAVSTFTVDLLNVTPDDCILDGQSFNATVEPTLTLDTVFLQDAADLLCDLGTALTEVDIDLAQVSVDAIAGATCTEQTAVLSGVPVTLPLDVTVSGTCGIGGTVTVNSGIAIPLPQVSLSCTAGTAGSEVQLCSTGTVPLSISLANPAVRTFLTVSVAGGFVTVSFQCNEASTTSPAPGTTVSCTAPNPSGECNALPPGDVGETPFPTSDCEFSGGFPGACTIVPVGVDPSTACATFTVE